MMPRSQRRPRFIGPTVVLLLFGFLAAGPIPADGGFPESPPHYADAERRRDDASLHAIAFHDTQLGIAVGDRGVILRTHDGGTTWKLIDSGVTCQLSDAIWIGPRHAVVTGGGYDRITGLSRGVALFTDDAGASWNRGDDANLPKLTDLRLDPDGRAVVAIGDWSPVSRTGGFRTDDGGKTWTAQDPPAELISIASGPDPETRRGWTETAVAPAPVRGRAKAGDQHLWAVGDHGFITHSADSGRTWQPRRGGDRRTALLVVAPTAADAPWGVLGNESFEFGRRVAMLIAEPGENDVATGSQIDRCRQATVALGGAAADRLVPPSPAESWLGGLEPWLVMHRPHVLLVDSELASRSTDGLRQLATRYGVSRVATYQPNQRGGTMLHASALLPKCGMLARDLWDDALHLVAPTAAPPSGVSFTRIHDTSGGVTRGDSVTEGVRLSPGAELVANVPPAPRRQLQIAQARIAEPARLKRLFGDTDNGLRTAANADPFKTSLNGLLSQTAAEDRFRFLWTVWRESRSRIGQDSTTDDGHETAVLELLAETFEGRSAGKWAAMRRDAIRHSGERSSLSDASLRTPAHGVTSASADIVPVSPFQATTPSQVATAGWSAAGNGPPARTENTVEQAGAISRGTGTQDERNGMNGRSNGTIGPYGPVSQASGSASPYRGTTGDDSENGSGIWQRFGGRRVGRPNESSDHAVDLAWDFHPAVVVARDASRRNTSDRPTQPGSIAADLRQLADARGCPDWSRLFGQPSHETLNADRAASPPRLDDRDDDACWANAAVAQLRHRDAQLRHRDGQGAISLRAAFDDDFVYFLIDAPAAAFPFDESPQPSPSGRPRDHDLSASNRLQLRLDTDRDLATSYSLEVTPNGQTCDSIDGILAWQPTWYVAPSRSELQVRFEIAISRRDLADRPIEPGQTWFVSARVLRPTDPSLNTPMPRAAEWVRVRWATPTLDVTQPLEGSPPLDVSNNR